MQVEPQSLREECPYGRDMSLERLPALVDYHEIVAISGIESRLKNMFRELVEFIYIDVREELARYIAKGQSFAWRFFKARDDRLDELYRPLIGHILAN